MTEEEWQDVNGLSRDERAAGPGVLFDVSVAGGKYRLVYFEDARHPEAYRHGERWPSFEADMLGSKVIMALVARIAELEYDL